jgi:four helix bundle protein
VKPARHYTDLIVWQLAEEVRIHVFRLTEKPRFNADFKARSQADDATNSMTRNIAEGFGCESHAEFARFLEISRRSFNELHDTLHGAELKQYVNAAELTPIRQLSRRLYPAYSRLIAYLKRTPNARPRRGPALHRQTRDRTDTREKDCTDKRPNDRTDKGGNGTGRRE